MQTWSSKDGFLASVLTKQTSLLILLMIRFAHCMAEATRDVMEVTVNVSGERSIVRVPKLNTVG